jgi:hypothetical protein
MGLSVKHVYQAVDASKWPCDELPTRLESDTKSDSQMLEAITQPLPGGQHKCQMKLPTVSSEPQSEELDKILTCLHAKAEMPSAHRQLTAELRT